jgi:hypothetical protein
MVSAGQIAEFGWSWISFITIEAVWVVAKVCSM